MRIFDGKTYRDMTDAEARAAADAEVLYWAQADRDTAIHEAIRARYSDSAEFAVLRQKEEKPEEYAAYFAYCEACKADVTRKIAWAQAILAEREGDAV